MTGDPRLTPAETDLLAAAILATCPTRHANGDQTDDPRVTPAGGDREYTPPDDFDLLEMIGSRLEAAQVRDADGVAALVSDVVAPLLKQLRTDLEAARAELAEASDALRAVAKAALAVEPTLREPYRDAPDTSPWQRFMEEPARRAYNLGVRLRRHMKETPDA